MSTLTVKLIEAVRSKNFADANDLFGKLMKEKMDVAIVSEQKHVFESDEMGTCTRCGGKFPTRTSGTKAGATVCASKDQCDKNLAAKNVTEDKEDDKNKADADAYGDEDGPPTFKGAHNSGLSSVPGHDPKFDKPYATRKRAHGVEDDGDPGKK